MSDPLGANSETTISVTRGVVSLEQLQLWSNTIVPEYNIIVDNPENMKKSPFIFSQDLNEKIVLW